MIMNSVHLLFYFSNQKIHLMNMTRYITFFIKAKMKYITINLTFDFKQTVLQFPYIGC